MSSDNASVNKGLQILHDGGYRVRRVRGNGQCLFSSIATLLLTEERLTALRSQLPNLKDRALYGDLDPLSLIDTCLQMLHDGVSVEALLQNPQTNDRWVNFLRTIATNWLHKEIIQNPECQVQLAQAAREAIPELRQNDNDREVCQIYLRRMASMTEPCYGGEPEIFALKSILGIDIHSIDVKTLGSLTSQAAVDSSLPQIADLSDIWLLYHGSHFDPLYLPEQIPHGMLDVD